MVKTRHPVTVILEDVRSALNVGAIFRTADAALIGKLILAGITPYPPHNKIPKTALGSIDTVPWEHYADKDKLFKNKSTVVAVENTSDATNYWDYQFPQNLTLIMGNEISGVSQELLNKADEVVKIPMYGSKESLNVATSFGIIIYEIIRQWRAKSLIA